MIQNKNFSFCYYNKIQFKIKFFIEISYYKLKSKIKIYFN
nr:MAG TPA: hypothetical protein [Caudoviricetes sp.]